jgi:hypothetical protein
VKVDGGKKKSSEQLVVPGKPALWEDGIRSRVQIGYPIKEGGGKSR